MGVLQRFERRLEGLVEGAFARVFKGAVEPVEIAAALQKEAELHKAIVGPGRVLVPNEYAVDLGDADHERLSPYAAALGREFAAMIREHADAKGWSFVGPVRVHLQRDDDLDTGVFHVHSNVAAPGEERFGAAARPPQEPVHQPEPPSVAPPAPAPTVDPGRYGDPERTAAVSAPPAAAAVLVVGTGPGQRTVTLDDDPLTIGRADDVDVQVSDAGVSRRHAEVRVDDGEHVLVDLGSTNGTSVNGGRAEHHVLQDGDRIEVGHTVLVYRSSGGR